MGNIKIYNWDLWEELCRRYNINPYEYANFSISCRQVTGGESIDYEFTGDVPEKED